MIQGKERIKTAFVKGQKPLLVAFTVAGDPDYQTSLALIRQMAASGADFIELGLPFSDPVADGPVIQRADIRAMEAGMNTDRLFDLVREFRSDNQIPVIVLTYANLIIRRGIDQFYREAAQAGIDGVVIADVPYEESEPFQASAKAAGMDQIMMISPTTSSERIEDILSVASGFIYMVAVMGITGARTGVDAAAVNLLKHLKTRTNIPLAPGFGISTRTQVQLWADAGADAVIVGSAIISRIESHLEKPQEMVRAIGTFIQELKDKSS
jgi:tryptophan synthase alpha chain